MDNLTIEEGNVQGGNRIIAEFMGAKFIPDWTSPIYKKPHPTFDFEGNHPDEFSSRYWSPEELRYHREFNWLMPVVEKIEQGEHCEVTISSQIEYIDDDSRVIVHNDVSIWHDVEEVVSVTNDESKLLALWQAVIQFIQWYNTQQQNITDGTK